MVRGLKRLTAIVAILLLMLMTGLCFSRTAWAAMPHMIDDAGAVSASELEFLENYLTNISEELEFDVVGVITDYGYDEESLTVEADDFYDYNGNYRDSYKIGNPLVLGDEVEIANTPVGTLENCRVTFCFTDLYQQKYWTPTL